ncbi:MAG: hypothetical protein PHZ07_00740 [Patescibacteria group bacterium]|nr:hypothetical protein [Patescibacteria group bacterium]MDD4304796.1 hypothetical protein [Patescibacteria group bacterium]MDD4695523.1 hypothetical protein [Patescibacteria group bacterium]
MFDKKIIIVDLDLLNRKLFGLILKELGIPIVFADSYNSAICEIQEDTQKEICLMMVNLSLPICSGKELSVFVHEERPDIRIILYAAQHILNLTKEIEEMYPDIIHDFFSIPEENENVLIRIGVLLPEIMGD